MSEMHSGVMFEMKLIFADIQHNGGVLSRDRGLQRHTDINNLTAGQVIRDAEVAVFPAVIVVSQRVSIQIQ